MSQGEPGSRAGRLRGVEHGAFEQLRDVRNRDRHSVACMLKDTLRRRSRSWWAFTLTQKRKVRGHTPDLR